METEVGEMLLLASKVEEGPQAEECTWLLEAGNKARTQILR